MEFTSALFSLLAAAAWGSGDFSGGLATKRVNVFSTVAVSHLGSLMLMILLALLSGDPVPPTHDLLLAVMGGLMGGFGIAGLYYALSVGQMGIIAPSNALTATLIPVLFGISQDGLPEALQFVGFGLAAVSIVLISRHGKLEGYPKGLGIALMSGVFLGLFFVFFDMIDPESSKLWVLAAARAASSAQMWTIFLTRRDATLPPRNLLPLVILAGVLDVAGNGLFLIAAQTGRLDTATVISSLYPAVPVILARLFLHEKINRVQLAGVSLALFAIILIVI